MEPAIMTIGMTVRPESPKFMSTKIKGGSTVAVMLHQISDCKVLKFQNYFLL
jgi:hypothetical protein